MSLTCRGISILGRHLKYLPKTTQVCGYKRWVSPTLKALQNRKKKMPEQKPTPRSSFLEWNYDAEIYAFCQRLNEDFDTKLLKQALTHKSYVFKMEQKTLQDNQNPDAPPPPALLDNNEMIEAGDKLLQKYIQSKFNYPKMIVQSIEEYLLNDEKLAYVAKHIGLTDLVLSEEYPVEATTLSNTLKAVVSALEQSSGLPKTHKFIDDFIITQLNDLDVFDVWEPSDPYKYLTESVLQGKTVEPRLCNQSAANTILANYQVGLYSEDKKLLGIGWGESVDIAKNTAAMDAIRKIYQI